MLSTPRRGHPPERCPVDQLIEVLDGTKIKEPTVGELTGGIVILLDVCELPLKTTPEFTP